MAKKIGFTLLGLVVLALLIVRFVIIDILRTDAPDGCPQAYGMVVLDRWAYGYKAPWTDGSRLAYGKAQPGDWLVYHQPAVERGLPEDEGMLCFGQVVAVPGDTLWYSNEDGRIDTLRSQRFCHPLVVPGRGQRLRITAENIRFYAITIMLHEPSKVCIIDDSLCVSGQMITHYTFQQDYYWVALPDTLHQSDSRSYGFIPHKSLVGKVLNK